MTSTLGFFTQKELAPVVGSSRRRERLQVKHVLPRGEHVKTFGQETIIFPEFAAAGLVADRPTANDNRLLKLIGAAAEGLYRTSSFAVMTKVMRGVLHTRTGWQLDDIVSALVEHASDELHVWRCEVQEAEQVLADAGIVMRIDVGRIQDVTEHGYRIRLADTDEIITTAFNAARTALPRGMWVMRDLIELGARKGEVLMPTVAPDMLASMSQNRASIQDNDLDWSEMFSNVTFQPVVVPHVRDTVDVFADSGDLVRPKRRLQVRADRVLYANANTMGRSQSTHPVR